MRIVEKAQLMSAPEIDRTLQRLAHEIVEKSGGTKNLALIGIVRRGVPLAQRIAQAMRGIDGVEVPVGVLDITLYRDDLSKVAPMAVLRSSDIPFGVDNMDLGGRSASRCACWWTAGTAKCRSRQGTLGARCRPATRKLSKCG